MYAPNTIIIARADTPSPRQILSLDTNSYFTGYKQLSDSLAYNRQFIIAIVFGRRTPFMHIVSVLLISLRASSPDWIFLLVYLFSCSLSLRWSIFSRRDARARASKERFTTTIYVMRFRSIMYCREKAKFKSQKCAFARHLPAKRRKKKILMPSSPYLPLPPFHRTSPSGPWFRNSDLNMQITHLTILSNCFAHFV